MLDITIASFNLYQIFWYFIIYSLLGWCIEVIYCSVITKEFVNRGFLNGPVCPIYGFGAVIVILLLTPIQDSLFFLFIGSVFLTSLLELFGGWVLEQAFHTRWWDYTDRPFNIGGYICLQFSLTWGLVCLLLMKVVHPVIYSFVNYLPIFLGYLLLFVFYLVYTSDFIYTVSAILKLNKDLGEITRIADTLHKGSEKAAMSLGNKAISVAQKIDELELEAKKEKLALQLEEEKEKFTLSIAESKEKINTLIKEKNTFSDWKEMFEKRQSLFQNQLRIRNRLLKAFPKMRNPRYSDALNEMKEYYKDKFKLNK